MKKYSIVDVQIGHTYCSSDDYEDMAYTYFHILDHEYGGDDKGWLRLRDNETQRSMSVVCGEYLI